MTKRERHDEILRLAYEAAGIERCVKAVSDEAVEAFKRGTDISSGRLIQLAREMEKWCYDLSRKHRELLDEELAEAKRKQG